MSELREQLDAMREVYCSASYPGDLAAELLPPPRRERSTRPVLRLVATGALISGLAAAVALWIGVRPGAPGPSKRIDPVIVATTTQPDDDADHAPSPGASVADLSGAPAFPDDLPLVPPADEESSLLIAPTELGTMPSMPSLDFSFSDLELSKEST